MICPQKGWGRPCGPSVECGLRLESHSDRWGSTLAQLGAARRSAACSGPGAPCCRLGGPLCRTAGAAIACGRRLQRLNFTDSDFLHGVTSFLKIVPAAQRASCCRKSARGCRAWNHDCAGSWRAPAEQNFLHGPPAAAPALMLSGHAVPCYHLCLHKRLSRELGNHRKLEKSLRAGNVMKAEWQYRAYCCGT